MKELRNTLATWTDWGLSVSLILVAIALILTALFVKNRWVKAGVLAYELLP